MTDSLRELEWLRRLRDLSHQMASQQDIRTLFPAVLDAAIDLAQAERGFLVRVDEGLEDGKRVRVQVEAARGFGGETLENNQSKVSRTVVNRVLEHDRSVLTNSEEDRELTDVTSVKRRQVRSILSVPMRLRGRITGVLYLDHRFDPAAFTAQDIPIVVAFADLAALALETADLLARGAKANEQLGVAKDQLERVSQATQAPEPPRSPPGALKRCGRLIGGGEAMQQLYAELERAARCSAPLLLLGESGTGKELVAREIHERSVQCNEPFVVVDCAAIPDALLESELFGHVRGAFTGAATERTGRFREAARGTVLLDEVGDMSPTMQAALLRVLQDSHVRPLGGDRAVPIFCRVMAATRHDLEQLVKEGRFREDLFYRLDVLRLRVPPLRQRTEDIPALLREFFADAEHPPQLTLEAAHLLDAHSWPGNVRELENEARRLVIAGVVRVTPGALSEEIRGGTTRARASRHYLGKTMQEVQREAIVTTLQDCGGNKAEAARRLEIPKSTIYTLIKRFGLE